MTLIKKKVVFLLINFFVMLKNSINDKTPSTIKAYIKNRVDLNVKKTNNNKDADAYNLVIVFFDIKFLRNFF